MWFGVITIFPQMLSAISEYGITARAVSQGKITIEAINPRDFTTDNYRRVDDRPFGGGAGMVMMAEPLKAAIDHAKTLAVSQGLQQVPVVYLSPQGDTWCESMVTKVAAQHFAGKCDGMVLLCGRYDGIDERLLKHCVDAEVSIGDFVLSGGELAAMAMIDSITRKLPEVMGDELSAVNDSFVQGLLDYPQYTKPDDALGEPVPAVLKSGHHKEIAKWRFLQQIRATRAKRPDLLKDFTPSEQQQSWLDSLAEEAE